MALKNPEETARIIPSGFYAGDMNSLDAWEFFKENNGAVLVDVRTPEEWASVGLPDIADVQAKMLAISFRTLPNMEVNKNFAGQIESEIKNKETPLLFICKAGGRSYEAAALMTSRGYKNCYNIYDGYEGVPSAIIAENKGWKNSLPWRAA